ncbi:condensation domain-containing protein, partial [Pseudomonas fontis]
MDKSVASKIAKRFITLPLDKRKLYLEKMLEEGVSPANLPIPEVQSSFEVLPLSYAQERQWFLWQLDPHSAAYHIPAALRLRGPLDIPALERSFASLVERHQSLRTTFVQDDSQTRQVIRPSVDLRIEQVQRPLAAHAEAQAAQIKAFVEEQTQRLFDLEQGPLLRVSLLHLGTDDHVLVLTQHHIISDGASMQVMIDELVQLYGAFSRGLSLEWPALPIQYADYALWQRHWMEAGERERQLAYWTTQLAGEQSVLALPTDHPRPAEQSFRGARHGLRLDARLSQALKQMAQRENVTLFMLLLASYQTLLHRYSGQGDIRVGVPVANRNRVETERLIGFFINTQILKAEVAPQQPFRVLLQAVRQAAIDAQAHQDLPFEQLVEALQPERSLSHNPLFQVLFNHQGSAREQAAQQDEGVLNVQPLSLERHTSQFDLTLETVESAQGVSASLVYATDLFDAATVARMGEHWLNLLEGIVAAPDTRVADLPMLNAIERQTIVESWNATAIEYPLQTSIQSLIEAQVERSPHAPAL